MSEEERNQSYRGQQYRSEKQEKNEKEEEKHEKSWGEKWRRDPLNAVAWALVLIWGGLVLLGGNLGLYDSIELIDGYELFFFGAGLILLGEVLIRLLVPEYRQPVIGTIIISAVFLAIGLGGLFSWGVIWALALIGAGGYVLYRGLLRRQE
jgi:hypothetical protein